MTVGDLYNMFLLLEMASKEDDSDFVFDAADGGPLPITGVMLDEDGDVCLESDVRVEKPLSSRELADAISQYDEGKTIYFILIDENGERELYNIKDGGTKDRLDPDLKMTPSRELADILRQYPSESIPHFETGTIYFTINSVYTDEYGCLCLESNEIEELDNYPVSLILEDLEANPEAEAYLYDDEAKEYYGIHSDERRSGPEGNPWFKIR